MKVLAIVQYYHDTEVHYFQLALPTKHLLKGTELKTAIEREINTEIERKNDPNWKPYFWEGTGYDEKDAAVVGVFELSDEPSVCDEIFYPGVSFNVG